MDVSYSEKAVCWNEESHCSTIGTNWIGQHVKVRKVFSKKPNNTVSKDPLDNSKPNTHPGPHQAPIVPHTDTSVATNACSPKSSVVNIILSF